MMEHPTSLSLKGSRRALLALAAACLLGACGSGGGDWLGTSLIAPSAWSNEGDRVTLKEAASVPYASMGIRVGGGAELMTILVSDMGEDRLWALAGKIAIVTRRGRIVRTAGFGHDLGGYIAGGTLEINQGQIVRWQGDFPDLGLYSVSIMCRNRQAGDETIVILGKDIHTRRIDESCTSEGDQIDWSFENTYWVDPANGLVWRSRQHAHPKLDAIETEILRPPL